jgi:hypothetical protein
MNNVKSKFFELNLKNGLKIRGKLSHALTQNFKFYVEYCAHAAKIDKNQVVNVSMCDKNYNII